MKLRSRVRRVTAMGFVGLVAWAGASAAGAQTPSLPLPSPTALPSTIVETPLDPSVLPSVLPSELLGSLPEDVDLPDLLGSDPAPQGGAKPSPQGGSAGTGSGGNGAGVSGAGGPLVDTSGAAATSARYVKGSTNDPSMSFAERAARLAGPMALPLAAAMLALAGVAMMARGRGSLGTLDDEKEAIGGWTVIRL